MPVSARQVLEILDTLADAAITVTVAGGWAVDALLDRETREHTDLDLAIDAVLVDRAIERLGRAGFDVTLDQRPARVELRHGERVVDLHPVTMAADGVGRQPGFAGEVYDYPPGSLDATGTIAGRTVRCLTPELLVRFHEGYEPREIDRSDMSALATAFDIELPRPYRP